MYFTPSISMICSTGCAGAATAVVVGCAAVCAPLFCLLDICVTYCRDRGLKPGIELVSAVVPIVKERVEPDSTFDTVVGICFLPDTTTERETGPPT